MNGGPALKKDSETFKLIITGLMVPVIAAGGAVGGAYVTSHKTESHEPPAPEYLLWSPGLVENSSEIIMFKVEKHSGTTWRLDGKWRWIAVTNAVAQ